jgi:serine protease Do
MATVANLGVGERAKVTVLRDGQKKAFEIEIGKRPVKIAAAAENLREDKAGELGIKVAELTPELARRYDVPGDKGVIVVGVTPEGKGEKAGIQGGDVIIEVNRKPVTTAGDLKKSIEEVKKGDVISLLIDRKNASLIVIKVTK